jgi:hypothetical protein
MIGRIACAVAALLIAATASFAQSLGDVARHEEERRATAKKAAIVLTNGSLRPGEVAPPAGDSPAPALDCYVSITKGTCVSAEEMVANSIAGRLTTENAPFEPTWRRDAESIRSQIQQTRASIATLEGVIADQGRSAGDRRAAEPNLAVARTTLADLERRWEKLERNAANMKVPRAWIEPVPVLSSRARQ